ncbi:MAG TPA: hypothetical protein PLY72_22805, partial [Candidatus Obscuribacter sp.]|nr:hypothetical protein [Candidatus Obscuribacter sp.]
MQSNPQGLSLAKRQANQSSKSKQLLTFLALSLLLAGTPGFCLEPDKAADSTSVASGTVLKGEVNYCVPKGTGIKLKLASVPTNGMRLL